MRVLLVLDQPAVTELVKLTLTHGAYDTRTTTVGAEAATTLGTWHPHLALVDMDLECGSILHEIATPAVGARVATIALTRRGSLKTKLAAFEAGADDILTIPFAPEELLARVVALVRRSFADAVTFTPVIKVGDLEIDILKRTVHNGSTELHLTALEQALLYLLAANAGRVVTRDEILDTLWGTDYVAESNIVDRQIRNLRARLRDNWRAPRFIVTVPGRGYQFVQPLLGRSDAVAS
ncbi:MAG: response regulator transcription factor [Chloroflexota bacterium]|nr:response regulator transcription factor [Chloroflexota bacterium]